MARKTWLVQATPITTHGSVATADTDQTTVLARGLPATPGTASGVVLRPRPVEATPTQMASCPLSAPILSRSRHRTPEGTGPRSPMTLAPR